MAIGRLGDLDVKYIEILNIFGGNWFSALPYFYLNEYEKDLSDSCFAHRFNMHQGKYNHATGMDIGNSCG